MMIKYDQKMENAEFTEDADIDDMFDKLSSFDETKFDVTDKETLKIVARHSRIVRPRHLGDWVTISVDGVKKTVSCNCERCNRCGKCNWVAVLEVLQFDAKVSADCKTTNEGFLRKDDIENAIHVFRLLNIPS